MIAGYAGASDKLDQAMAAFARAYADQTESDHGELVRAVRRGRLPVTDGALEQTGSAFRPGWWPLGLFGVAAPAARRLIMIAATMVSRPPTIHSLPVNRDVTLRETRGPVVTRPERAEHGSYSVTSRVPLQPLLISRITGPAVVLTELGQHQEGAWAVDVQRLAAAVVRGDQLLGVRRTLEDLRDPEGVFTLPAEFSGLVVRRPPR